MIDKRLEKQNFGYDVAATIVSVTDGQYKIIVNGEEHVVKDGVRLSPTVGSAVWVRVPNGKWNNAFIEAIR